MSALLTHLVDHILEQPVRHAIVLGSVTIVTLWCLRRVLNRRRLPPGPFALPLIGNIGLLTKKGSNVCAEEVERLRSDYGDLVTLMAGPTPMVIVLRPELVQEGLLRKELTDRSGAFFSFDYISEGMNDIFVSPNNKRWRFHRKASFSAFRVFTQSDRLERFILDSFDSVKKYIAEPAEPRDLYETVYLLTYNLQCRMVFSTEYTPNDPEFLRLRRLVEALNMALLNGLPADAFPVLKHLPLSSTRDFRKNADELINWAKQLCQRRQKEFNPSELNDILDFLIHEQRQAIKNGDGEMFQDVHLRQTLMDIFIAGTDTTTFTLYYLIIALSLYPEMQERCFAEIKSTVGQDRTPTLADRDKLPYTDAFLHEVMRYWPLVPQVPRQCNENCSIGGYNLPKGTQVMLCTYNCHFDEGNFSDARQFKPEHFLTEEGKLAPYQRGFLPFGAGTRVCLGESIAKKTTFLLSVLLIQSFRFEKCEEFESAFSDSSNILFLLPRRVKTRVVSRSS